MNYLNLPKISIVIPSFNASKTIEKAINSLIIQNYPNLELILIDGNSSDDTVSIAKSYESYFSCIISEPDQGQANALNKGFRLASGEIWGWLCVDDELAPGALQHAVELFNINTEVNMIVGGCRRIFADETIVETKPHEFVIQRISYQDGIEQPSCLWKSSLHRATGELDETYHFAFDWDWWNRLKLSGAKVATTDYILSYYYFSDSNKTSTGGNKLVEEMYIVIKKFGPLNGYLADIYKFIYYNFDLYGCYDKPIASSQIRYKILTIILKFLIELFGEELIYSYNWNFASKQERGLCWFK